MDPNKKAKRKIIREYIKNHPSCTYREIRKNTKVKVERVYKNMKEAYKDSCIKLSKNLTKRNVEEQKQDVKKFIRKNPNCSVTEIQNNTKTNISRIFGSILEAYKYSNVEYQKKETISGVRNPLIVKRYKEFENRINGILEKLGKINTYVRTQVGIVDCIFEYNGIKFVVEIKDYRGRNNITMFEIKQLIRYMEFLNYKNGLLICPKESFPKRKNSRNLYISDLNIKILSEEDLRGHSISHQIDGYNLARCFKRN